MSKEKTQDQLDFEALEKAMGEDRLQLYWRSDFVEEDSIEWKVTERNPDGTPSKWERDVRGTWTSYYTAKGK